MSLLLAGGLILLAFDAGLERSLDCSLTAAVNDDVVVLLLVFVLGERDPASSLAAEADE